jgi:putative ABC transport system ATP-binding protein
LIVADEPTGDLDARSAEDILNLLDELQKELRKTILMVTHDPRAAQRAHRILHLEKGQLVEQHQGAGGAPTPDVTAFTSKTATDGITPTPAH